MNPSETSTPSPLPKRVRRLTRALFRCFRTTLAGLLLIAGVLGLFLNKVGLPGYVKRRVVEEARARGLDVEFSRLRLRWYRGIVAENLHIQSTNHTRGPQLFVEDAECPLNPGALRNFGFKMNSLRLRGGRLIWPLSV